jgi:putative CocE/NonD family hydrolase
VPGNGQARDQAVFRTYDPARLDPADPQPSAWTAPAGAGYALAYTSPPLDKDVTALGSASVDLSITSTAPDTDVQVVLTEVRPDGQEMYVQAGWLRASHRVEDVQRSEPTRPFHTHRREDWKPLVPGAVERLRVEINPFGHVFRAGSSIRVWVEAPAKTFGLRSLEPLPFVSQNQVHHDAMHPSVLRLSTLPGRHAPTAHPACGSVIRQPCRVDPLTEGR